MPLKANGKQRSFEKEKVLLVEGNDEVNFIKALCEHCGIDDIQVEEIGGKSNLPAELKVILKDAGFRNNVKAYGVIRDADADNNAAIQSVQSILRNNKQPVPRGHSNFADENGIKVGIFIMPGDEPGMLEDLCFQTVDHPISGYVNAFIDGLGEVLPDKAKAKDGERYFYPKNINKARLAAFLSAMHEYKPSLGIAAKAGYFDFNSEALRDFKSFLGSL